MSETRTAPATSSPPPSPAAGKPEHRKAADVRHAAASLGLQSLPVLQPNTMRILFVLCDQKGNEDVYLLTPGRGREVCTAGPAWWIQNLAEPTSYLVELHNNLEFRCSCPGMKPTKKNPKPHPCKHCRAFFAARAQLACGTFELPPQPVPGEALGFEPATEAEYNAWADEEAEKAAVREALDW